MLNQLTVIGFLITYLPTIAFLTFDIIILVFGILIFKKNSYRYGILLMFSSILSIVYYILYFSIQYPVLIYLLVDDLGLSYSLASMIMMIWGIVFTILNLTSALLLVISVYLIYKTHKAERTR